MGFEIPLARMTVAEKLRAIEEIWSDLIRSSTDLPASSWHADVLRARERRVEQGTSRFVDWPNAKARIRSQI